MSHHPDTLGMYLRSKEEELQHAGQGDRWEESIRRYHVVSEIENLHFQDAASDHKKKKWSECAFHKEEDDQRAWKEPAIDRNPFTDIMCVWILRDLH